MNITLILAIALLVAFILIILILFKHNKLRNDFRNYDPNPVFGPGRYNYGLDDPSRILKEQRIEVIRKFFTFKWTWYWTTKEYRKKKKTKKELNKRFEKSITKRKKAKKLREKQLS